MITVPWNFEAQNKLAGYVETITDAKPAPDTRSYGERMKEERQALNELCNKVFSQIWGHENLFKDFLNIVERFNLSPVPDTEGKGVRNAALIYAQYPEAVCLYGFGKYGEMGARVNKGSVGINILVPNVTEKDGKTVTYYNPAKVFDVTQTNAKVQIPVPQDFTELDVIQAIANTERFGIDISEDLPDGIDAAYIPQIHEVWVRDGLDAPDMRVALLTEYAHCQLSNQSKDYVRNPESVFIACSCAYLLSRHYGLDTRDLNFPKEAFPQVEGTGAIKEMLSTVASVGKKISLQVDKALQELSIPQQDSTEVSR